jgi:hypothetical protein
VGIFFTHKFDLITNKLHLTDSEEVSAYVSGLIFSFFRSASLARLWLKGLIPDPALTLPMWAKI